MIFFSCTVEHVFFYSVSLINVSQIAAIPETIFSPLFLILLLLSIPTVSSFPGNAVTSIVTRMVCVFLVMKGQWQWHCVQCILVSLWNDQLGVGRQQAHSIFRSSLCTRQVLDGISAIWKRHVCSWAVQLLLPLHLLVPSRSRSPWACQGQGWRQEMGLVLQTPRVVFWGWEDTPVVWSLCSVFTAWPDFSCHKFGTQMTEVSLTPVVQKKNKRMRLLDRLLTAELPVLKSDNIVFLKHQLPESVYHWEQHFAFLTSVS